MLEAPGAASGQRPAAGCPCGVAAGTAWVNRQGSLVSEARHGGINGSGFGSDLSLFSMEPYTQVKHVMIRSV